MNEFDYYLGYFLSYYEDKECTQRIKGLIRSSKARQVKKGTIIIETPYAIR